MGEYRTSSVFNVLSELGRLFEEASVTRPGSSEQNAPPDLDVAVMKHLYEKTCQDCGNRAYCWEEHFGNI